MKITELLKNKELDRRSCKPITIAFIGDSVTQGCFECYMKTETALETVFDYNNAYSTRVGEILHILYPSAQVNIINSGISGDNAPGGLARLERDVLAYDPDLCIVSFGLNDSVNGKEGLENYTSALEGMFSALKDRGCETIFLTENVMCTTTSPHLKEEKFISLSKAFSEVQNSGILHEYFDAAKSVCSKYGVVVCDLHTVWEKLISAGVNTTELLSNKLNHPIREIHYYMAMKIVETILMN